ncbi:MAG: glycosyltransferase [bacterium]|nr:glycosyltransferase [bacterium]
MKILQVFDFFSPLHGGGIVSVVYQLSRALADRGHDVSIYTSDFERDDEYIRSIPKVKVHTFRSVLDLYGFHFTPDVKREAKAHLRDFDIVHFQCYRSYQNAALFKYLKKFKIPYVIDSHGTVSSTVRQGRKRIFDLLIGYRMIRNASRCIAETEVGIDEYMTMGVDDERIVLLPPGFNTDEYKVLPAEGNFRKKFRITAKKLVMFFGRINHIKGVDFLVESFGELVKEEKDAVLVLAGPDDGLKPVLLEMIKKLNLGDKVLFTGFLSNEDKLNALVDADLVVQPSRYENGIAWSSLDALMCNTPIIVCEGTGSAEDVRKMDGGFIVPFGAAQEMRKMMIYVLEHPEAGDQKVKNAKKYIEENLSLHRNIIEYENMYQQCITENKIKTAVSL